MLPNTRNYCSVTTAKTDFLVMLFYVGPSSFLRLPASSNRPKFLAFPKKKTQINDLVKPFFTWNNSLNLKNEHSDSIEKNRNKNRSIFYSMLCILKVNFKHRPGVPGVPRVRINLNPIFRIYHLLVFEFNFWVSPKERSTPLAFLMGFIFVKCQHCRFWEKSLSPPYIATICHARES